MISYGVETVDRQILRQTHKGYSADEICEAFRSTQQLGMRTIAYFMAGLPGETAQTLRQTIDFSIELAPDFVSWGVTALYPGSPLYEKVQADGSGRVQTRYAIAKENGHASGSPYGAGYAIIYEENLTRQELERYVRQATRAFYLRPGYLIRFLFKIRSGYELWHFLNGGWQFLLWAVRGHTGGGR